MYAVIQTGGKQYRVAEGTKLRVEKLPAAEGDDVAMDKVLMLTHEDQTTVGTPYIAGASVTARVTQHGRGNKVRIIKFRRRKHHMKRQGHRQHFTQIEITQINAG